MADMTNQLPDPRYTPSARDIYDLKEQAKLYYDQNKVPERMEDILNSMFYDNPKDVYGHLSNYFEAYSEKPLLSKITANEVLDSKGQPTIHAKVFCTVKNNNKLICSVVGCNENIEVDHAPLTDREQEESDRQENTTIAIDVINSTLNDLVCQSDPNCQDKIDEKILGYFMDIKREADEKAAAEKQALEGEDSTPQQPTPVATPTKGKGGRASAKGKNKGPAVEIIPDEPREEMIPGCSSVSVISTAVCQAAAIINDVPLYHHIAQLKYKEVPGQFALPQLMISLISSGKAAQGKLNAVKDFMIIPKYDMSVKQATKNVTAIYNTIAKNLSIKAGVSARYTNDTGCLCPLLDKIEQGLDLISEAVTQLGFKLNEDFFIALNCGVQEIYDFDKGKYEVMQGQLKLSEEMVEFWSDIVSRYPSVIALIDPIRKQEKESWMRLAERLSEKCLIGGDFVLHRPGLLKDEDIKADFKTSAATLRVHNMNSISDVIAACNKLEEENHIIMSTCTGETQDSFITDLAVGLGCRFLRIGAPCRGERISKLNRLINIEDDLEQIGALKGHEPLNFYKIELPPPPPPSAESVTSEENEKEAKKK